MKKFIIENDFWELFPDAKVGVVVCNGIDNTIKDPDKYQAMITAAEKEAEKYLVEEQLSTNEVLQVWRDAFKKFKNKKGARSTIEALLKRVHKGNPLSTINPLVDIYNSISLRHALPSGGEDIDSFVGDVRLTKADGDEEFITLGAGISEPPYEGEIIYKDDAGAVCRCWNWREAERTMLTEDTKDAFLVVELVDESRTDVLETALSELAELVEDNLGGTCKVSIVEIDNPELVIAD